MTNKKTMAFVALGVIALLGISLVAAYQGDTSVQGPNYDEDRHEAMQEAFETYNYDLWVTLMTEDGRHPGILDKIDESNFELFADAHNTDDPEEAAEIRAELDLGQGMQKMNKGSGMHKGSGNAYKGSQGYNGECPYSD